MSFTRRGVALLDEGRNVGDRHRDVVLDRAAFAALHLAEQLADAPERLGLLDALADGGVEHEALLEAFGQDLLHRLAQALAAAATTARSAPNRATWSRADRACRPNACSTMSMPSRAMISKLVTPPAVSSVARPSRSTAACTDGIAAQAVSTDFGRGTRRSTAAVMTPSVPSAPMNRFLQVVAGVVLLQLVEVVQDAAVGQHHLEAERMRARDAVGQRRGAAGVGREVAADGAASLRRQQLRIEPVDVRRRPRARAAA